jgi:thiamine biosynthesis lipoprotein
MGAYPKNGNLTGVISKVSLFILATIIILISSCGFTPVRENSQGRTSVANETLTRFPMGTTAQIKVWFKEGTKTATSHNPILSCMNEALDKIDVLDHSLSSYKEDSDTTRVNEAPAEQWIKVSQEFIDLLKKNFEFHAASQGLLDPSVKPLLRAWRVRWKNQRALRDFSEDKTPSLDEIKKVKKTVGLGSLFTWREKPYPAIMKKNSQSELAFGATGKGFALDTASAVFKSCLQNHSENHTKVFSASLRLGGQYLFLGDPKIGPGWQFGIADPFQKTGVFDKLILRKPASISTSSFKFRGAQGSSKNLSHLIHPKTGKPIEEIAGVTVISKNALLADALSSILSIKGLEKSRLWLRAFEKKCKKNKTAVFWIDANGKSHRFGSWDHWIQ